MKWMIASDLHGSAYWTEKMLVLYAKSGASRMLLLGDILYHGPRNDLPRGYAPKEVTAMLTPYRDEIFAVRGNCEAEVDQMVLPFPCMADYCIVPLAEGEKILYATHGHIFNEGNLPPMKRGDVLLHGHTHVWKAEDRGEYILLNPGSVSIPKEGNVQTCAFLEDGVFSVTDLEGAVLAQLRLV